MILKVENANHMYIIICAFWYTASTNLMRYKYFRMCSVSSTANQLESSILNLDTTGEYWGCRGNSVWKGILPWHSWRMSISPESIHPSSAAHPGLGHPLVRSLSSNHIIPHSCIHYSRSSQYIAFSSSSYSQIIWPVCSSSLFFWS